MLLLYPHVLRKACLLVSCIVAPALMGQAWAYPAVTIGIVNLRAGPDRQFPVVRVIPEQQTVDVKGCESDYQWCDVLVENQRGWVKADYLSSTFQETEINVAEKGVSIGLPIVAFALGAYWADHYFDRPWYRHSHNWNHWHYHPRPPAWRPPHRPPGWHPPPPTHRPPVAGPSPRPPSHVRPPAPHRPPSHARPPHRPPAHDRPSRPSVRPDQR